MVNKKTIGIIQISIGIILLIGGIIGFCSIQKINNDYEENLKIAADEMYSKLEGYREENLSYESRLILISLGAQGTIGPILRDYNYLLTQILFASSLAIIFSLLFITQGLANMSRGIKNE